MKKGEKVAVGLLIGAVAVGTGVGIYYGTKAQAQGGEGGPVADFTAQSNGLTIQCYDLSTREVNPSYHWDFGDGRGSSTAKNPSYTYTAPGTYRITLTVVNADGKSSQTWANIIVNSGGGTQTAHPQFRVGDTIQEINGSSSDPYYQMKITKYVAGDAPYYGSYVTLVLTGPYQGGTAIFWVKDVDGYYKKVG